MLSRIGELVFTEAVRRYLESLGEQSSGWLAGLRDRAVGRALALMHGEPARHWTLDELASATAVSRTIFAERFTTLVGHPPMQYLSLWRMQVASQALLISSSSIAQIATQVGYESEAAFSRAFRKLVGSPPAAWRRERTSLCADRASS
jgi:AraC-like DNA-binding protein